MKPSQTLGFDKEMPLSTWNVDKSVEGRSMETARGNMYGLAGALASF
jgi:hypothetical protein